MRTTSCFPFLLLIFSLRTAEIQAHSNDEAQRKEPATASDQPQTHTQDIDTVLREMSAQLAEQKVEIKRLQTENQGTVACKAGEGE